MPRRLRGPPVVASYLPDGTIDKDATVARVLELDAAWYTSQPFPTRLLRNLDELHRSRKGWVVVRSVAQLRNEGIFPDLYDRPPRSRSLVEIAHRRHLMQLRRTP